MRIGGTFPWRHFGEHLASGAYWFQVLSWATLAISESNVTYRGLARSGESFCSQTAPERGCSEESLEAL